MSAPYREATTRDLDRERALYMLTGAAVAIAAVLSWPIVDVLVAAIVDRLVGSGDTLPRESTRLSLVIAGRVVPAALTIVAIQLASSRPSVARSTVAAWLAPVVLGALSLGATHQATEITSAMVRRLPESRLLEWLKGFETIMRVETLAGPAALLLVLVFCVVRADRERASLSRTPVHSCPHCGGPTEDRV